MSDVRVLNTQHAYLAFPHTYVKSELKFCNYFELFNGLIAANPAVNTFETELFLNLILSKTAFVPFF